MKNKTISLRVSEKTDEFLSRFENKTAIIESALKSQVEEFEASLRLARAGEKTVARENWQRSMIEKYGKDYASNREFLRLESVRDLNFLEVAGDEVDFYSIGFCPDLFDCDSEIDLAVAKELAEEILRKEHSFKILGKEYRATSLTDQQAVELREYIVTRIGELKDEFGELDQDLVAREIGQSFDKTTIIFLQDGREIHLLPKKEF